jgi:hypothetical protein
MPRSRLGELSQSSASRARSPGHDRLFGVAWLRSHRPTALRVTPSLAASSVWLRWACRRYFLRVSERAWGSFTQGGGTTLMARSTRWQKGCRRVPLRHLLTPGMPVGYTNIFNVLRSTNGMGCVTNLTGNTSNLVGLSYQTIP